MNLTEMESARHARERGTMLEVLRQGYGSELVTVKALGAALNMIGVPMTADSLQFSLTYLADQEYVRIVRAKDTPGYRADRLGSAEPDGIVFAKLLPKGLALIDGRTQADPMVTF